MIIRIQIQIVIFNLSDTKIRQNNCNLKLILKLKLIASFNTSYQGKISNNNKFSLQFTDF